MGLGIASALCYMSGEEGLSGEEALHSGPHVSPFSLNPEGPRRCLRAHRASKATVFPVSLVSSAAV